MTDQEWQLIDCETTWLCIYCIVVATLFYAGKIWMELKRSEHSRWARKTAKEMVKVIK